MRSRATHLDRKSTRLNSSHLVISYAVFCLKNRHLDPGDIRPVNTATRHLLGHSGRPQVAGVRAEVRGRAVRVADAAAAASGALFFSGAPETGVPPPPPPGAAPG